MTLVRGLIEHVRHLLHEIAKFGVIGGIGFIVTELGFNVLHFSEGLGLFTANAIATGVAAVVTFVGNKYWTFAKRGHQSTTRETVIFFLLNGIGALIQYGCAWTAKNAFGVTDKYLINVAFLIGIGLATLFRFWSYRKWVWGVPVDPEPVEASPRGDLIRGR